MNNFDIKRTLIIIIVALLQNVLSQDRGNSCVEISRETTITSANYPDEYDDNIYKCWFILGPVGTHVQLTFNDFNIEAGVDACYDTVLVFNDEDEVFMQGCPLCGLEIPRPVITTGNRMLVRFYSDASISRTGFSARISFIFLDNGIPMDVCSDETDEVPEVPEVNTLSEGACLINLELQAALKNIVARVPDTLIVSLLGTFHYMGYDLTAEHDIKRLACVLSEVDNAYSLTLLVIGYVPEEHFSTIYDSYIAYLNKPSTSSIRKELVALKKLIQWIHDTGFPTLPLRNTDYGVTWQFFTELQQGLPDSFMDDFQFFYNYILGYPMNNTESRFHQFFTESPEALTRVMHDANSDVTAINEMFSSSDNFFSVTEMISMLNEQVYQDIKTEYTPLLLASLELYDIGKSRGWFSL